MKTVRVTKQFTFEMASALPNYDGDCANIHGHSYTMDVTLGENQLRMLLARKMEW